MFSRATLEQINQRIANDILARLDLDEIRRSDIAVIGKVQAAVEHGLNGYLEWIARQLLPDTCDEDRLVSSSWLNRGLVPTAASFAVGSLTVTGQLGVVIPAGTVWQRVDGQQYASNAEVAITSVPQAVAVTAKVAGLAANATAGTGVVLVSPVIGVQSAALVAAGGLANGSDAEKIDSFRARVVSAWGQTAHGGADFDYVAWAKAVPGVTRVWVKPNWSGLGTVGVFFVRDGDAPIFPDPAEIAAVQSAIDLVRPVTAAVSVLSPVAKAVNFNIQLTPATAEVKAAVQASLAALFLRDAAPGATVLISRIREAISQATGESDHVLNAPTANITTQPGEMATLGSFTWS
ncbi:baseplate J/gp47 family protein [Chitinibacter fontanus]|uniref:Baseplate J/gp47 family protein n=1 Tax=Chitinibacter fontanus TaxID=1737446 RepID=A0A7D5Z3Y0_9NEIS|nr:baseplate J/gp47 family protein [Chitinibacter fontanus]QLI80783.1 baseplate J/gp47 family protein [Chitinibacter fontanus]